MILISGLVLAFQGVPQLPNLSERTYVLVRSYSTCLESKSVELEPSKADFDDIFEAAKTGCARVWGDSYELLIDDLDKLPPNPAGKSSQAVAIEVLTSVAEGAKSEARLKVLQLRAGLETK